MGEKMRICEHAKTRKILEKYVHVQAKKYAYWRTFLVKIRILKKSHLKSRKKSIIEEYVHLLQKCVHSNLRIYIRTKYASDRSVLSIYVQILATLYNFQNKNKKT